MRLRAYYKLAVRSFRRGFKSAHGLNPVSLRYEGLVADLKDKDFDDQYIFIEFLRFTLDYKDGPHAHLIAKLADLIAEQRKEAYSKLVKLACVKVPA